MQIIKESIFVSAIRAFFNALLAMIGVLVGLVILISVLMSFAATPFSLPEHNLTMEIMPDANGNAELLPESAPALLRIDFTGIIGDESNVSSVIESYLRASQKGLFKNGRVKGVLLYINSPGGDASESDLIYHALSFFKQKMNVPIYAFTPNLCASGGYYIACASDKIFASPIAILGSVGAKFGPNFNLSDFIKNHGISSATFAEGKYKDKLPMFQPWDPAAYQDLLDSLKVTYNRFVGVVATARASHGLTQDMLTNTYGANVYAGDAALQNGYADAVNAYYETAIDELAKECKIDDAPYQVVRFSERPAPLKSLVANQIKFWSQKTKELLFGVSFGSSWNNQVLYYYDASSR